MMPRSASAVTRIGLGVGIVALVVLHVAPPRCHSGPLLWGGIVPWDLGVHLVWMAAAWAAIIAITQRPWTGPEDDGE